MTQRGYRRLTHFLFIFLFVVFFLLYLLLSQRKSASLAGGGWGNLEKNLGQVELSEIRSGGFIVDRFPLDAAINLSDVDFDENVLTCRATLHNEGVELIKVAMDIYGTVLVNVSNTNPGLCASYYYYSGGTDPLAPDYAAFLADPGSRFHVYPPEEKHIELRANRLDYPTEFMLEPDETKHLVLLFWVDEAAHPLVTDQDRANYSVTVKFTARTP